ncbi:MAG: TlpA family protein disulfide reductase [Acidobacteria bacterium]|nr:TlpA family protein disulfide reductase [Acidobacteriota bacterium]MBS1864445.1 TlpA family protein disulfide reductase [Acidobacteriota bacterium]
MRVISACLLLALFSAAPALAQEKSEGPADEKAKKTYAHAVEESKSRRDLSFALDDFKKADKQDGGHCKACQRQMVKYGIELSEWKTAELGAAEMIADAKEAKDIALAHYQYAVALVDEGKEKHKDEYFSHAHDEIGKALAAASNFPDAIFLDGMALASIGQDDAAKSRFEQFIKARPADDPQRQRAVRFIDRPELARARMVPNFSVTTADGRKISMDGLQGKVVLLDFWATWCGPCREALPHIQQVAKKFKDEPLVVLSVSLDNNEHEWREFIEKHEMTWPQYYDGGFTGPIARMFGVRAIPHTFTVDADGVLQEEHVGDASIEGKLKKLIARAHELQSPATASK